MSKLAREPVRSLVVFAVSLAGFVSLLLLIMNREGSFLVLIETGLARSANFILRLLGNETHVMDQTIWSSTFYLKVIPACTGVYPLSVYLSGVIAYPSRWLAKLIGAAIGVGGIFALNIVRLVSLFYVGVYFRNFLDEFHLLVWQSLVIVSTLLLWLFWVRKMAHVSSDA